METLPYLLPWILLLLTAGIAVAVKFLDIKSIMGIAVVSTLGLVMLLIAIYANIITSQQYGEVALKQQELAAMEEWKYQHMDELSLIIAQQRMPSDETQALVKQLISYGWKMNNRKITDAQAAHLADALDAHPPDPVRLASTLAHRRTHLPHRLAGPCPADRWSELAQRLRSYGTGGPVPRHITAAKATTGPRVALLFVGQGSQWSGMGHRLYASDAGFRASIDAVAAALDPLLPHPLRPAMFGTDPAAAQRRPDPVDEIGNGEIHDLAPRQRDGHGTAVHVDLAVLEDIEAGQRVDLHIFDGQVIDAQLAFQRCNNALA